MVPVPRALAFGVALLSVVGACRCFEPVDEPDGTGDGGGGAAGGSAAGGAAGGHAADGGGSGGGGGDGGFCATPAGCSGTPATPSWCGASLAGFSCVEGRCLWECPLQGPGRTCQVNQATYCLECGDAGTSCPLIGTTACGGPAFTGEATVESGSCATWPQSGETFVSVSLFRGASAQCRFLVSKPDGGEALGEVWKLPGGDALAYFPGWGGWCTGRSAFSGAPRSIFTCPSCAFVLLNFE